MSVDTTPYKQVIKPGWIGDFLNREHLLAGGAKIDAAAFTSADAIKVAVGTTANIGGESLTVAAISEPIPSGTLLDFGARAAVVVTLTANSNATTTSLTFSALTGAIPSGTLLDFGTNKFARTTAAAPVGATTVAVSALPTNLVSGDAATVPAVSSRVAKLVANAAKGAVTLAVAPLTATIYSAEVSYYSPPGRPKRIQSGTLVGATYAEIEDAAVVTDGVPAGLKWGPAADTDDVIMPIVYDLPDADKNNNIELYRPGGIIKVNNMPNWANVSAAVKAKVRAAYQCTIAATES